MAAAVELQLSVRDDVAARSLTSVLAHTPADVGLFVTGPGASGGREWLDALPGGSRLRLDDPPGGDLAVLDARTEVPPRWLARLEAAALVATGPVATISPLTLGAGPTSLVGLAPRSGDDLAADDRAVRQRATGPCPRTIDPSPACVLVTRAARELAGPIADGFAARCSELGLLHVVAADVLVSIGGAAPDAPLVLPEEHEWQREQEELVALGRARMLARRAVAGLSVTLDGRALSGSLAGTQIHTLELACALHRTGGLRLRVVVPPDLLPEAETVLTALEGVELLPALGIDQSTERSDIVHRPYQVSSAVDAKLLRRVAARRVITHQDLLGFHNPAYHPTTESWAGHRRLTRATLAAADLVVAFSEHVAADLLSEDLTDPARLAVVPIGVDHRLPGLVPAAAPPHGAVALAGAPFLVCVGTNLRHKNRPFALALLSALRERGWEGRLAFAGPRVAAGGSAAEEEAWAMRHPEHARAFVDLGPVEEAGKAWLFAHAAAVLYPTTSEGFGLIPFEAAAVGTPCLHAGGSALDEFVPGTAVLVPWDVGVSAERALPLLRDPKQGAELAARIGAAGADLGWDRTAERLVTHYETLLTRPASAAASVAWTALAAEDRRGHFESVHAQLVEAIGPTGLSLVGANGLLPEEAQRTLAGLARRPRTRGPLLRVLSGLRRVAARG